MIKLVVLPGGGMDVELDDSGDASGAVATVVYALLQTDARAPVDREADSFTARGWWADATVGSGLWHVRRQGLSAAARLETVRMVEVALAREPALTDVVVTDATDGVGPGSVSGVQVAVSGKHNGLDFLIDLTL